MAVSTPYQAQAELLQLLRQRDSELAKLREERQHKETTIDFLKTKIVTLQNQNRAALSERPAPAVEDLQRRLDAAVQAKDRALHRQEELVAQLQDAQMEVGDLRQELTQARAEVARLQTELERKAHLEQHNGLKASVPRESSVLIAVEELERELAQDVSHIEEVPVEVAPSDSEKPAHAAPREPAPEPSQEPSQPPASAWSPAGDFRTADEGPGAGYTGQDLTGEVGSLNASASVASHDEAASPPELREVASRSPESLSAAEEERDVLLGSMMSITSQDLPDALTGMGQVQVSATGALINFFDSNEDAATIEAKRQRMARQIERRRQARRQLLAPGRRLSATSNDSREDTATEAASEKSTPQGVAAARKVPEVKLPAPKDHGATPELPAWAAPEAQSARSHGSVRPGEIMDVPVPARPGPDASLEVETSPVLRQARGDSGLAPPGKASATTPTLHSKFEGLRDEMKRRRSAGAGGSAAETVDPSDSGPSTTNEVAQTSRSLTFGGARASPAQSPNSSPRVPSRSVRVAGVSPHPSSPQNASRGVTVVSAQGPVTNPGGRSSVPQLSFVAGSATTPGRTSTIACGSLSPGRQVSDDQARFQGPAGRMRPGQASSVLVAPATVTSPVARSSVLWREESQPRQVHGSFVAGHQTLGAPGELDRSRRNVTMAAQRISVSASTGNIAGSFTARPPEDRDEVHEAVVRFAATQSLRFPLARLSKGVYNYGNKKLLMTMHNSKLMVRTGGGFATLESCIAAAEQAAAKQYPPGPQLVVNARRTSKF